MTMTHITGGWTTEATEGTDPPKKRVTPPLLMGDILAARNGVPVFVSEWLRLEKERDERRALKRAMRQAGLGEGGADRL
ncbi:MAG: hypothetical protein AAGF78_12340 [Pseudomonadota bacterium]